MKLREFIIKIESIFTSKKHKADEFDAREIKLQHRLERFDKIYLDDREGCNLYPTLTLMLSDPEVRSTFPNRLARRGYMGWIRHRSGQTVAYDIWIPSQPQVNPKVWMNSEASKYRDGYFRMSLGFTTNPEDGEIVTIGL
jgi:hypothetical protein